MFLGSLWKGVCIEYGKKDDYFRFLCLGVVYIFVFFDLIKERKIVKRRVGKIVCSYSDYCGIKDNRYGFEM